MHRHQLLFASVAVSCIAAWAAAIGYTAPWDLVGEGRPGVLVALYAGSDLFWGVVLWYGIQTARGRFGSLRAPNRFLHTCLLTTAGLLPGIILATIILAVFDASAASGCGIAEPLCGALVGIQISTLLGLLSFGLFFPAYLAPLAAWRATRILSPGQPAPVFLLRRAVVWTSLGWACAAIAGALVTTM